MDEPRPPALDGTCTRLALESVTTETSCDELLLLTCAEISMEASETGDCAATCEALLSGLIVRCASPVRRVRADGGLRDQSCDDGGMR